MKEKLLKNIGIKILSVVISVVLWLVVVNIDDPVKTVQFSDVPVQIVNSSELTSRGMVYEVLDDTNFITVSISGRRSIIEDISKENITATADMLDITSMSTISIKVAANKYANELNSIKSDTENLKLSVENAKKIQCSVSVDVIGTLAPGYSLGELTSNLNQISVEGPESIISEITSAKVELDVSDASANLNTSLPIKLYDSEGSLISSSRISLSVNNLNVSQEILPVKELPITYSCTGTPADGYSFTGEIRADISTIKVAARKTLLDRLDSISIPAEAVNIDGASGIVSQQINLKDYLPTGVEPADRNFDGMVNVTVSVQKETFNMFMFDSGNVKVIGVPAGLKAEVVVDGTNLKEGENMLRVYGLPSVLEEFDADNVSVIVNLNDYMSANNLSTVTPGIYDVEPSFGFPDGAHLKDKFEIRIKISKI